MWDDERAMLTHYPVVEQNVGLGEAYRAIVLVHLREMTPRVGAGFEEASHSAVHLQQLARVGNACMQRIPGAA